MARTYQVISADGHVEVPPDVWVKYVPAKWRDRAPRLVKLPEGGEGWIIEGQPLLHNGQNITAGDPVRFRNASYFNPDGSPHIGAGDAKQRLREQDMDGIDAEVLFPPIFATKFLEGVKDRPVYLSMVQAYNTFLAQDYCSVAPDRLIGNAVIPITGIDDAVAELKRIHSLGLRGVAIHQWPNGCGTPKPEDDRFWETALSLGVALSPHADFGDRQPNFGGGGAGTGNAQFASALTQRTGGMAPMLCLAHMVTSGLFDRFPSIRFYFAETNASWMPAHFWIMDDNYRVFRDWFKATLKRPPTEYIREHVQFGIIRDPMALQLRDHLPVQNLMWGSDFPHSVGSFPRSREFIKEAFGGVPEGLKRRILLENPASFFKLDVHKPITPTPN